MRGIHKFLIISSLFVFVTVVLFHGTRTYRVQPQESNALLAWQPMDIDFDQSMQKEQFSMLLRRRDYKQAYDFFKKLYEQNNFKNSIPYKTEKIPKIIHMIWLGGKLPTEYEKNVQSWAHYHPKSWKIVFWTDNEHNFDQGDVVAHSFDELSQALNNPSIRKIAVDTHALSFDNRPYFDKAMNYGEKSDILRWEVVYRFGGVYVDTDFECFRSLDIFNHCFDFYTGIQPLDTNIVQLGAALYGSIPGHPILKRCVQEIKNNQSIAQIIIKTGPIFFTKIFLATAGRTGYIDVAFPSSYFYPCSYEQRGTDKSEWCKPESYAVHHWAGSWLKPEGFVRA